jgi:hypothetical protein
VAHAAVSRVLAEQGTETPKRPATLWGELYSAGWVVLAGPRQQVEVDARVTDVREHPPAEGRARRVSGFPGASGHALQSQAGLSMTAQRPFCPA